LGLKDASFLSTTSLTVPLIVPSDDRGLTDLRSWSSLYEARGLVGWYCRVERMDGVGSLVAARRNAGARRSRDWADVRREAIVFVWRVGQ
jgi:hypothetical protein